MTLCRPFLRGFTVNPPKRETLRSGGKKALTGKFRSSTKTNLMMRFNGKGLFIMKIYKNDIFNHQYHQQQHGKQQASLQFSCHSSGVECRSLRCPSFFLLGAEKNISFELNSLSASWGACLVSNYPCVSNHKHRETFWFC